MHLRGKDFTYTAVYPDGRSEVVLSVPKYDFNWQLVYMLKEPLFLPKGSRLDCVAHFDNSPNNKYNPDPTKEVKWDDQTWEEMMIGWFDYTSTARTWWRMRTDESPGSLAESTRCVSETGKLTGFSHLSFVRRRTVYRGDGDIIEPQIHPKLGAVMDCVVHYEAAQHGDFGHGHQRLAALEQRPGLHQLLVARARNCRSHRGDVLIE
jgi:hypothetical protein